MHSRILQMVNLPADVTEIETLLEEREYNHEDDIYESMKSIADYVDFNKDSFKEDVEWFNFTIKSEKLGTIENYRDVYLFTPNIEGIKDYYGRKLIKVFDSVKSGTAEDFMSSVWDIQNILEDKYGFYIYDEDQWAQTLDCYLKEIVEYNHTAPKLILNSYDYHF